MMSVLVVVVNRRRFQESEPLFSR